VTNVTRIKALIRNLSKEANIEAEVLLRKFMIERLLERISVSNYRENFILKGGTLITSIVGVEARSTMDVDVTITGQNVTSEWLSQMFEEILEIPTGDDVKMRLCEIVEIREQAVYPGFRLSIEAILEKTRQILKVDITTGESITPKEIDYHYKLLFEDREINLRAYNLETILAEKLETIMSRGESNTRMRDFYDIYILSTTQKYNEDLFKLAYKNTIVRRGTVEASNSLDNVIDALEHSLLMKGYWERYSKQYPYANNLSWEKIIKAIRLLEGLVVE